MPEVRGTRMVRVVAAPVQLGRGFHAGRGVGAYGILRGFSPVNGRGGGGRGGVGSPEIGKENVPPERSGSSRRRRRKRRSPLPAWYPRTPLRDITVIVNAIERRRIRLREIALQRNQDVENSPIDASPDGLIRRELIVAEDTSPSQPPPSVAPGTSLCEKVPNPPPELIASPSPTICKPLSCADSAVLAESEKRLSRSIDEIEKRLKEKSKNTAKDTMNASRRSTLMSMR